MKGIMLPESKISEVLNEARLFAIGQAGSRAPDWITVRREVFEHLIGIAGLALEALTALTYSDEQLTARADCGNFVVELEHAVFGNVRGEGRSLLGAMVEAKLERQRQIAQTAACELNRASNLVPEWPDGEVPLARAVKRARREL